MTIEFTFGDDQIQAGQALAQTSPKLRDKAAIILAKQKEQGLISMTVEAGAIAALINDFNGERLVVMTWMGHYYPISSAQWQTVSLDASDDVNSTV